MIANSRDGDRIVALLNFQVLLSTSVAYDAAEHISKRRQAGNSFANTIVAAANFNWEWDQVMPPFFWPETVKPLSEYGGEVSNL